MGEGRAGPPKSSIRINQASLCAVGFTGGPFLFWQVPKRSAEKPIRTTPKEAMAFPNSCCGNPEVLASFETSDLPTTGLVLSP